ncbi:GYD domain-containing protein [Defluviimonas sp. WL0024]|uniref:GYD domain-containing protein n=2 Tax=Albidovulum TaxID=205889 RepID=A0ABT3J9C8_9RHOB|nr:MULTISPECIES: GYD domain-containing protein [Defluviimonas]MCU9849800.1 GYD domain-containing protein [Defluviimonas sp. WL0024]MCW3784045.1 GYD domain-containing protein [Defluviimonas salinarum]
MGFYLFQGSYAPAAIKAMIEKPQDRRAAAAKMIEAIGGKLHHMFFCFGSDDIVALVEAPDDKAMIAGSMLVGGSGSMSAGRTTKLISIEDAMAAMKAAQDAAPSFKSALD